MLKKTTIWAAMLLSAGAFGGLARGDNPADFAATTWVLCKETPISARGATAQELFGGFFTVNFGAGTVLLQNERGDVIEGTYDFDKNGKLQIELNEEDMAAYYEAYIDATFGDAAVMHEVRNLSADVKVATSYHDGRVNLTITMKFAGTMHIEVGTIINDSRIDQPIVISGDHPVAGSSWGSQWLIETKTAAKVKRLRDAETLTLRLTLGDFAGSGLGINEYELLDVSGATPVLLAAGDFCRRGPKIALGTDGFEAANIIEDLLSDVIAGSQNVSALTVDSSQSALGATLRGEDKIRLTGRTGFDADLELKGGGSIEAGGSLDLDGRGTRTD